MGILNIILVEDNEDHFFLIEEVFKHAQLKVNLHRVRNGFELMTYLHKNVLLPDLILLDLNMPRKGGRAVLQELKATPKYQHIPIVILTTSRYDNDRTECEKLGAEAFISKPTSFDDFVTVIKLAIAPYLHSNGRKSLSS